MARVQPNQCCLPNPEIQSVYDEIRDEIPGLGGEILHYKKGQVLFYAGHQPFGFFILKNGKLILKPPSRKKKKREVPQDRILGLSHLLTDTPYCYTCQAASDVEVVFFPKASLLDHCQKISAV